MDNEIDSLMRFDGISEVERVLGESYKGNDAITWAGFTLQRQSDEKLSALLHLSRDTNSWDQSLEEWEEVIREMGFEMVLEDPIPGTKDVFRVWWNPSISALLHVDSYWDGESVNGSTCHFFVDQSVWNYHAFEGCSHGPVNGSDTIRYVSYDARRGLKRVLERFRESGCQFLTKWPETPFLWLLHYMDLKKEGYDYKAITAERISRLPENVRNAIIP